VRLTIILPSLEGGGGAERAVVWLARGLVERGHEIAVITLSGAGEDFHALPAGVGRVALDVRGESGSVWQGLWRNLRRMKALRRAVRETEPHKVISHLSQTNVLTTFALLGAGLPLIVVEHSGTLLKSPGRVWRALRRAVYPFANRVVCVSRGAADYFDWLPAARKTVIYNPLILPPEADELLPALPGADMEKRWLVAMGRLLRVKGFDLLLRAWAEVAPRHDDWQLVILGNGPLRGDLAKLCDELGLGGRVVFAGRVANPFPVLRRAGLFALPSRAEGLPYALLEAMACGCAAAAFDCPDGPREIIRHEIDGLLVPNGDAGALAAALERLMTDETERRRLAARAPEVLERFSLERAVGEWERLLDG
jgi:glycosyltransferase involved in cell wall biosynthesis